MQNNLHMKIKCRICFI